MPRRSLPATPYAPTHLIARYDVLDKPVVEEKDILPCFLMDRQDLLMRLRTRMLGKAE